MNAQTWAATSQSWIDDRHLPAAWRVVLASCLGAGIVAVELAVRSNESPRPQVIAQLLAFALFLPAAWLCWGGLRVGRTGTFAVLAIGIALQAAAFDPHAPPPLTTDTYRYAWDARVQAARINPYRYVPNASALAGLRDEPIWRHVNRKDWTTLYPPGAEASFLAARVAFGTGVRATTWMMLLALGAAAGVLLLVLRRTSAPLERIALLVWHPLVVSEIAANGHSDALALLACALLLGAWAYGRKGIAGLVVGLGALVKLGPIFLLPVLLRAGGRRFLLGAVGVTVLGYAAYFSVGTRVIGSLFRYLDREDLGSLAWWLLQRWIGRDGARTVLLVVLLAVIVVVSRRAHDTVDQVARSGLLVLGSTLLAAALLHPWYALWLIPFLVVTPGPAWLWLTGTLPLLYVFDIEGRLPLWVRLAVYGPFLALAVLRVVCQRRAGPATKVGLRSSGDREVARRAATP